VLHVRKFDFDKNEVTPTGASLQSEETIKAQKREEAAPHIQTSPLEQCYQTEVMVRFKNTFEGSNIACGAATIPRCAVLAHHFLREPL
jgi:hypothetical protein